MAWLARAKGLVCVSCLLPVIALAEPSEPAPSEPAPFEPPTTFPFPTAFWLATQAIPSPALVLDQESVYFGLAWQLTPLLYSWSANSKVLGLRTFVVEPNLRYGGSIELYASPEVLFLEHTSVLLRPGIRAYFPLLEHGEMLSSSFGVSFQDVAGTGAVAGEVGIYGLFGILGLQLSHAPAHSARAATMATLRLRYF